ncbi:MAG: hypothetical protein PHS46_01670 [Candidatus Omnitrophica bacterium]|nr:hypothetical protein [Candidatus Omnitrophota bacterium]
MSSARGKKGFMLVFAMVIIVLVILSLASIFLISFNDLARAKNASKAMRAYYIAEAGLAKKFMDLRGGSTSAASGTFTLGGGFSGTYSATVTSVSGSTITYRIVSTGTYGGVSRQVSITVKQVSFSRYGYFSNSENELFWFWKTPIWFTTGDHLTGPLFTNDSLNICGNPIFEGPVSSVGSAINYYHGGPPGDNPEFYDSLTLGATAMQTPSSLGLLSSIQTAASTSGGLLLTRATSPLHTQSVTFLSNGTLNYDNGRTSTNYAIPTNGAIYVSTGTVNVSGVVNGSVTLGAASDIYVTGNILYNTDPRVNSSSSDLLGLVSQNNVYVSSSAPYNLEIDAYIVAVSGSFEVYNYDSVLKGDLYLYGGVTQTTRGAVGTFNADTGDKVTGYTKDYEYDARLSLIAPAYFPAAKDSNGRIIYAKVLWAED